MYIGISTVIVRWFILCTICVLLSRGLQKKPLLLCANASHDIRCGAGEKLIVTKAVYGRSHWKPCNGRERDPFKDGCTKSVLPKVQMECARTSKSHCMLYVNDDNYGLSRCSSGQQEGSGMPQDLENYLDLQYICVKEENMYHLCSQGKTEIEIDRTRESCCGILLNRHDISDEKDRLLCNYTFSGNVSDDGVVVSILNRGTYGESNATVVSNSTAIIGNTVGPCSAECKGDDWALDKDIEEVTIQRGEQLQVKYCLNEGTRFTQDAVLEYRDASVDETVIVCSHHEWIHQCPQGQVHLFTEAIYGRQENLVCQPPYGNLELARNCSFTSANVLGSVSSHCFNQSYCNLTASKDILLSGRDPCPKVNKYLNFTYTCVLESKLVTSPVVDGTIKSGEGYLSSTESVTLGDESVSSQSVVTITVIHVSEGYVAVLCDHHFLEFCERSSGRTTARKKLCTDCDHQETYVVYGHLNVLFPEDPSLQVIINYKVVPNAFNPTNRNAEQDHPLGQKGTYIGIAVGLTIGILFCIVVVLGILLFKRRSKTIKGGTELTRVPSRANDYQTARSPLPTTPVYIREDCKRESNMYCEIDGEPQYTYIGFTGAERYGSGLNQGENMSEERENPPHKDELTAETAAATQPPKNSTMASVSRKDEGTVSNDISYDNASPAADDTTIVENDLYARIQGKAPSHE